MYRYFGSVLGRSKSVKNETYIRHLVNMYGYFGFALRRSKSVKNETYIRDTQYLY
ncbi:hypothetical protein P3S68_023264 [Capsicum galapagoense]